MKNKLSWNLGRILPVILCLALSVPSIPHASASDVGAVQVAETIWDWLSGIQKDIVSWIVGDTPADIKSDYDNYVQQVQEQTGTATVIDGGVRLYYIPTSFGFNNGALISSSVLGEVFGVTFISNNYSGQVYAQFASVSLPFDCTYVKGYSFSLSNADVYVSKGSDGEGVKGTSVRWSSFTFSGRNPDAFSNAYGSAWIDCISYTGVAGNYYGVDIGPNSRVGSIAGDFGVIGDNNTVVKSEQNYIVNETNNTVYNPATGESHSITNWAYDYSTRTYNLTVDTGDKITVTYGDEHITINEGDTIYNVYYLSPSGTTDPEPSPSPSPGPGSSGGDNSNNSNNSGSWFGNIVINIGDIMHNIFGGGSGSDDGESEGGGGIVGSLFRKVGDLIGAVADGIIGLIESVLLKVLDALIALVEAITERLQAVVSEILKIFDVIPTLFSGFMGFLGAVFVFLPDELVLLIEFGIFATIFVGLLLLFLKR